MYVTYEYTTYRLVLLCYVAICSVLHILGQSIHSQVPTSTSIVKQILSSFFSIPLSGGSRAIRKLFLYYIFMIKPLYFAMNQVCIILSCKLLCKKMRCLFSCLVVYNGLFPLVNVIHLPLQQLCNWIIIHFKVGSDQEESQL